MQEYIEPGDVAQRFQKFLATRIEHFGPGIGVGAGTRRRKVGTSYRRLGLLSVVLTPSDSSRPLMVLGRIGRMATYWKGVRILNEIL